ncbi:shikimate kinase [Blastococcus sp. TF02A-35]|uniref:shikimate kinase n=1 Tax=Blastococcus sp. TF02A-35 TaxID=2559612 RepID=UPI0010731626|nr:shikimate kinase [Blastococcus sp. TF02A_35]TFV51714.1 shikimate kinase [Blastococcus sp. TF02A_35]
MAVVLVTGMSGAGKSTVLAELARLGHRVVDTDDGGWIEAARVDGAGEAEPLRHEQRMAAPLDVLLERVSTRPANPFGRTPADRARIAEDTLAVEPLLRRRATHEIDTRRPLDDVVRAVLVAASGGASEPPDRSTGRG